MAPSLFCLPLLPLRNRTRRRKASGDVKRSSTQSSTGSLGGQGAPADASPVVSARQDRREGAVSRHAGNGPYRESVEAIRRREYPSMSSGVYLDHSGTTIPAASLINAFASAMVTDLWGNPHSQNLPARRSGHMVDAVRHDALRFLGADPEHFDLVFVANATAGIKLVADAFRDAADARGFWYGYHGEVHNSILGVRELAKGGHHCFLDDRDVEAWIGGADPVHDTAAAAERLRLFAYPGQSNLTGRRLPQSWPGRIRASTACAPRTFTLFDASALAMTASLAGLLSDPDAAPDFTCLSFYKIFGFPDLGALVVRKASAAILGRRSYFGGGTVARVNPLNGTSVSVKKSPEQASPAHAWDVHDGLEDGTLPFHSILALRTAMDVHEQLYGSMDAISKHCTALAAKLHSALRALRHRNGGPVIELYADRYGDSSTQGGVVAFNVLRPDGSYVSWMDVERHADEAGVYVRAGGMCCPGGIFKALRYHSVQWNEMVSDGFVCGSGETAIVNEKPTGIVRASIGAMTTDADIEQLVLFLQRTYTS